MKFRKIAVIIMTGALVALLSSCQLSKILPDKNPADTLRPIGQTTATSTTTPGSDAPNAEPTEPMDLANTDLSPYLTLGTYKGLTAEVKPRAVTDKDLEEALESFRQSCAYYTPITDRKTQSGDKLNIDYVGTMDGVAFDGGTAQGQSISLTANSGYIDGFADGLVGVMPGTTVTLDLTFPENYHEGLSGKPVTFTVTVNYIQGEQVIPELTDDFIKELTEGDYTTFADFRAYYRTYLEAEALEDAISATQQSLWETLVNNSTIKEVPTQQIDYYYHQLTESYRVYAASYGMSYSALLSALGITDEKIREEAREYATHDLIFYALVQAEQLAVTDAEYNEQVELLATANGVTATRIEDYYGKDYLMQSFLYDKCLDFLLDNAAIAK